MPTPASAYLERAARLLALLQTAFGVPRATRTVIAVAGESGSGKSVTAIDLAATMNDAGIATAIIHQDNYFIRPPRTNHEHRLTDLSSVGPQEVRMDLIASHIAAFRAGESGVSAPVVNYPENCFEIQQLDFTNTDVLVVEGTYALQIDDVDVRIFLEATYEDTAERRRVRNRDIDAPIIATILAMEHAIIAPQGQRANITISRDFVITHRR